MSIDDFITLAFAIFIALSLIGAGLSLADRWLAKYRIPGGH